MDDLTALATATHDGDRVALGAFVRRAQPDVWRLCASLAGRDAADDLTQEALLRAIQSLGRFRGESSARTWVLTIARRTVADEIRTIERRRRRAVRLRAAAATTEPASSGATDLSLLVASLEPEPRQAFVLTQIIGMSYEEAAEICGCAVGTIRSRVARARASLVAAHEAHG